MFLRLSLDGAVCPTHGRGDSELTAQTANTGPSASLIPAQGNRWKATKQIDTGVMG